MKKQPRYEAVINSGGIAGFSTALTLSKAGGRVAIVEPRGALLWEICKARQEIGDPTNFKTESLAPNAILSQINSYDIVRNGVVEPVLLEIFADRMAKDAGIDVYFQSRVAWSLEDQNELQIVLAQKGRRHSLYGKKLIQFEEKSTLCDAPLNNSSPEMDLHTILFINCSINQAMHTTISLSSGEKVAVRMRQSAWENECYVDIAYPIIDTGTGSSELELAKDYEQIIVSLKEHIPALTEATPVYLSDEPWRWRTGAPKAKIVSYQENDKSIIGTEQVSNAFSWDKCLNTMHELFVFGDKVAFEALNK